MVDVSLGDGMVAHHTENAVHSDLESVLARLFVKDFSCIHSAEVDLRRLTIIIGPQASGKSVISKLIFFCNDLLSRQYMWLEDEKPYSSFISGMAEEFKKWFPPSAWGREKFMIDYNIGPVRIQIQRRGTRLKPLDEVSINISDLISDLYDMGLRQYRRARSRSMPIDAEDSFVEREYESFWKIRDSLETALSQHLGSEHVRVQTFVPAGRSFFTSIGKAIAAFDQGGMLDPVTVRFGRLFAAHRERNSSRVYNRQLTPEDRARQSEAMSVFFGGKIRIERESEYVEAPDGRRVPFHVLSSGQQELLPLWMVIGVLGRKSPEKRIIYIEEPEAHLFPSAQSLVVEYLSGLLSDGAPNRRMVITTHSPYVLAKVNNLIRAGDVADRMKHKQPRVESVVPKASWMKPVDVNSYAIIDGHLVRITDEEGLIDAEYLDSVSSDISMEFSQLLEIEMSE